MFDHFLMDLLLKAIFPPCARERNDLFSMGFLRDNDKCKVHRCSHEQLDKLV